MSKIVCPPNNIDVSERIEMLFKNIDEFISSNSLIKLVVLFGGIDYSSYSLEDKIKYLSEFVKRWDFRNNVSERWAIRNNEFIDANSDYIMQLVEGLDMVRPAPLESTPDYILILGGARSSNLDRPTKAHEIYKSTEVKPIVVGLSCKRKINEIEYEYIEHINGPKETEFDVINRGIENAFGVSNPQVINDDFVKYNDNIFSISARPAEGKRANTLDTFKEFINLFNAKGKNIVIVSNPPYVSYQLLKFIEIAFDNNLFIEAVGCSCFSDRTLQASNYLQEIKANIDAISVLAQRYDYGRKDKRVL